MELVPAMDDDNFAERVYHYKRAGEDFAEIAERLELTTSQVVNYYRAYMRGIVAEYSLNEREYIVATELDRLDKMMQPFYAAATVGDKEGAETTLKIMSHRMKLLRLDQPTPDELSRNTQVIVVTGTKEEFEEALRAGRQLKQVAGSGGDDEGEQEA